MRALFKGITRFLREADIFLFILSLVCTVYGTILVSSVVANPKYEGGEVYIQIGAMVIGIFLFVLFSYIDIDVIADKTIALFIFSILLISTLFIWGVGAQEVGNRGWLRFWGIGIQPAEVVKVPFTIIIAKMISNYKERKNLNTFPSIIKILAVSTAMIGMIIVSSTDVGNPLMYVIILLAVLYIGGVKLRWFLLGGGLIAAISPLIWNNFFSPYHRERILVLFIPEEIDPTRLNVLWQSDLSVRAISSGGFLGQGLGSGRITQAGQIPEQHTDFIFSAAGEELGFVGCMLIVLLLVLIIIRCIQVGIKSNNSLGLLVCTGFATMFIAQTFENIGMCLGILPVIGITLPFFSYGGSSIVTCLAAMGIVSGVRMRPTQLRHSVRI